MAETRTSSACRPRARSLAVAAVCAGLLASGPAGSVTVQNLKGMRLESLYGRYGPGGDCSRKPVITVSEAGFSFDTANGPMKPARFEYAAAYGPRDYTGISLWFFPFIVSDDDLGPLLMTFNADEKRGRLTIESQLAPGARMAPAMAALAKGSPYARCARQ